RGLYRIGRDLDADGAVTGGWTPWIDVPDWFSWENQGGGIAVADITGTGRPDLVVLAVDNPPGRNQACYRIGTDLDADGIAAAWSVPLGINNWSSWDRRGRLRPRCRAGRDRHRGGQSGRAEQRVHAEPAAAGDACV